MCVDFTDLNKACPKDSYPLPSIDALVDNASGCKLLSFLDAFSGYNQIKMHPMDKEKTTFMTERSCYCYRVMPFGLKNAGATYQRLMDKVLAPMLGRNVQAYVDDMVVTSLEKDKHVTEGAATHGADGRPVSIRIGKRREGPPILPMFEEEQQICLDKGV